MRGGRSSDARVDQGDAALAGDLVVGDLLGHGVVPPILDPRSLDTLARAG